MAKPFFLVDKIISNEREYINHWLYIPFFFVVKKKDIESIIFYRTLGTLPHASFC